MAAVICYKDQNSPLYQRADALKGTAQVARVHGSDIQGRWVRADLYIPNIYTQTRFREKTKNKQKKNRQSNSLISLGLQKGLTLSPASPYLAQISD